MKFHKENIYGSYDEKYDVLYIYYKGRDYSYGTEDPDGFVTMRSIENDKITGYLIYDFKKCRLNLDKIEYAFRFAIKEFQNEGNLVAE